MLRRLCTMQDNNHADDVFTSLPANDYRDPSLSIGSYEQHTLSGYGCLASPHSFAEATHVHQRILPRRRSGPATTSQSPVAIPSEDVDENIQGSEKQGSMIELSQPRCTIERCREETTIGPQWDSSTQSPDLGQEETHSIVEDEVSDTEQVYAVILQAKREKLLTVTPQLQRKTKDPEH